MRGACKSKLRSVSASFSLLLVVVSAGPLSALLVQAVSPTAEEFAEARRFAAARFQRGSEAKDLPSFFSFTYDGKPSAELLKTWDVKRASRELDERRTEHTLTYTDPKTGLAVRCVAVEHRDFPTAEWTLYFKNAGDTNTPILQDIRALDLRLERGQGEEFALRGIKGDWNSPNSYEPYTHILGPNASKTFTPAGGRPTNGEFPYYNLAMPGGGVMLAVGWPGQWTSTFARDAGNGLKITAGQQSTRFYLKPGEEIRTPLIAVLFWKGSDTMRAQNLWRRWMRADNLPRPGGQQIAPLLEFCTLEYFDCICTEAGEKQFIDALNKEGIRLDYWWEDAGWYPTGHWSVVGTWEVDTRRFPGGIKAISDYVHARGMKLILWFEPELAVGGTWLAKNHPEWILKGPVTGLLNLGNSEAWNWIVNRFDKLITDQGVDLYRQDFNMNPLEHWRGADAPDRQGITEIRHIEGYLALWDELHRRHPDLLIDSCASGGRRNDLETLRRAVPLWRSDYAATTGDSPTVTGNQGHTYGLSSWIPYYGTGVYSSPTQFVYGVRSCMSPSFMIRTDIRKGEMDWDLYRRLVSQWRQVADCMLGDYYPLTPYSLAEDRWIAWQFDQPEHGKGVVQAFRRKDAGAESICVKLHGLDGDVLYTLTNLDVGQPMEVTGRELLGRGLSVVLKDRPGSAVITYQKKPSGPACARRQ